MNTPEPPLVLIEPYAHRVGGHHQYTLHALTRDYPDTLVITGDDVAGVKARLLSVSAWTVGLLVAGSRRVFAPRWWPVRVRRTPHQLELARRCLAEAAYLRAAALAAPGAAAVILTASEALHTTAAVLGGTPHLRFVHEVNTTEDLPLRLLGDRMRRRGRTRVGLLCPTSALTRQLRTRFPDLSTVVRTYAVDDGTRLTNTEIADAREAFGIAADAVVVCLVGGWWPHKDIATVGAALAAVRCPLHVLIAGDPVDREVLAAWQRLPGVRVHVEPGPVPDQMLRMVYAAADASLVARHRGVGKESGLVLDTARLGVPLIVSDHDPDLTRQLSDQPWARRFAAGDAIRLATVLDQLTGARLSRPPITAPAVLGMPTAADQATFLIDTHAQLFGTRS